MVEFIPATEQHYAAVGNLVTSPEELYLVYPSGHYPWYMPVKTSLPRVLAQPPKSKHCDVVEEHANS